MVSAIFQSLLLLFLNLIETQCDWRRVSINFSFKKIWNSAWSKLSFLKNKKICQRGVPLMRLHADIAGISAWLRVGWDHWFREGVYKWRSVSPLSYTHTSSFIDETDKELKMRGEKYLAVQWRQVSEKDFSAEILRLNYYVYFKI